MDELIIEMSLLLRHGGSTVCVEPPLAAGMEPAVWLECAELWVEVWLEKRLRLAAILYGEAAVLAWVKSLPAGRYSGQLLERLYLESLAREGA
jgi:hypothetical protein